MKNKSSLLCVCVIFFHSSLMSTGGENKNSSWYTAFAAGCGAGIAAVGIAWYVWQKKVVEPCIEKHLKINKELMGYVQTLTTDLKKATTTCKELTDELELARITDDPNGEKKQALKTAQLFRKFFPTTSPSWCKDIKP